MGSTVLTPAEVALHPRTHHQDSPPPPSCPRKPSKLWFASTCEVQNRPELFHEQLTSICWAPIHSVKSHHRLHSSKIRHWGQCRNIESYLKKSGTTNQTNSIQNKIHSLKKKKTPPKKKKKKKKKS